ncbi:MAG TPA: GAF domain-containing protein [Gaiellales bacterium]
MSDGLRLAAALAALLCAAGCIRLAFALARVTRKRRTTAGAALLVLAGSVAVVSIAIAAALVLDAPVLVAVIMAGAIAAGVSAAFAVPIAGSIQAPASRTPAPGRSLDRASRVAAAGATAASRDEVLDLIVEEARSLLSARAVLVLPVEGGDRAAVEAALAEHGAEGVPSVVVPFERDAGTSLAAVGAEVSNEEARELLDGLAAVGRSALAGVTARAGAASARRLDAVVGGVARKLAALHDSGAVAAALAAELRSRLPIESVGVRLGEEPERWYPAPAAPEDDRPRAEEVLVFDGFALGTVAYAPTRPLTLDEELLADRVVDAGALALGVAGLRSMGRQLAAAQAALVRAAESLAAELHPDRVLQRLAEVVPSALHADAAAIWLDEPEQERLRVTHVHGHPITLLGATVNSRVGAAGAAITGGRPVVELHEADDPAVHRALDAVRRELAVPLRLGGRVRGALVISSYVAHPGFSAADVELGQALARLASLAVETATAYDERGAQARIDRASSELTAELAMARNSDGLRESLARVARQTLGADAARVRLAAELEDGLANTGAAPIGLELLALRERRVVASGGLGSDSRVSPEERRRVPGAALLAVPISHDGARSAAGVVTLLWRRTREFDDADVALAERLRVAAAAAVERVQLEEAERRASTTARELQRVGALLAADLDPRAVLRQIVAQAVSLLGADACALRLLEEDELVLRAAEGAPVESLGGERLPVSDVLAAEVLATSRPVALDDLAADGRLAPDDPVLKAGFASWAGAPIASADGGVQGMLAIFGRHPRRLRDDEVEALAAFANSASVALRNALLYEAVASEKDRVAAILGRVADAIVATDAEDRITLWNTAAEEITQIPERRALGRTLAELLTSELGDADHSAHGVLAGAGAIATEVRLSRAGQELWLSVTAADMSGADGRPGRVLAMRDISEVRALEQLKSDFVATVSHELRTPLTSIYGFAETLLREDASFGEEDRASFVRYIASEAERLNRLVDGLLSAARLETGAVGLTLAPVDVAAVARDVAPWAGGRSEQHKLALVLPPGGALAEADADRVRQVLINLIDNAIKYSPDGGTVTVRVRKRRRVVELRVSDEGIGISERDQRNLFQKFFRVDAAMSRGIRGIGLGLYLVRGFVTAMGGRIWVESEQGKGSTFVVELPASEVPAAAGQRREVA